MNKEEYEKAQRAILRGHAAVMRRLDIEHGERILTISRTGRGSLVAAIMNHALDIDDSFKSRDAALSALNSIYATFSNQNGASDV